MFVSALRGTPHVQTSILPSSCLLVLLINFIVAKEKTGNSPAVEI